MRADTPPLWCTLARLTAWVLCRTLELPGANSLKGAHTALDAAVLVAYGSSAKKDLLAQLLELNLSVAQRLEKAKPLTPPGIPAAFSNPETLAWFAWGGVAASAFAL